MSNIEASSESKSSRYRPEIDGLRAFAVIAVIINHFNKEILPGGYLGVDIFFVISGYVITSSLDGRGKDQGLGSFIGTFYARRIKRLIPALVVFAIITTILICLVNPNPEVILRTGLSSLLGLSNLYLLRLRTDYFAESTELNPFTHTWSLGVEEQFYFIFPLIVWFTGFSKSKQNGGRFLLFALALLSSLSFARYLFLFEYLPSNAYFEMPSRFWEIAMGAITYLAIKILPERAVSLLRPIPGLAFLVVIAPIMLQTSKPAVFSTLAVVLACCCLLAKREMPNSILFRLLTQKYILRIGIISYSLYLYHWTILSISKWTIGISLFTIPFQVFAMIALASLSYRYVETPFRSNRNQSNLIVMIGGILTIASTAFAIHLIYNAPIYSGKHKQKKDHFARIFPPKYCNIFDNFQESIALGSSCGIKFSEKNQTIFLLGDSHANQFNDQLLRYGKQKMLNVVTVVGNGCNFPPIGDKTGKCYKRQSQLEAKIISKIKQGDIIIVGNALVNRLSNHDVGDEFELALNDFSTLVEEKGGITVLYIDSIQFPGLKIPGALCSTEWFRPVNTSPSKCITSLEKHKSVVNRILPWRTEWANKPNNIIWNAVNYEDSCDDDDCTAARYLDSNHFSKEYASFHFKQFSKDHLNAIVIN